MSYVFGENSRVKIPASIHLTRLGYKYISQKIWLYDVLKDAKESIDGQIEQNESFISSQIFSQSIGRHILTTFRNYGDKQVDFGIVRNLSDLTAREYLEKYQPKNYVNFNCIDNKKCC